MSRLDLRPRRRRRPAINVTSLIDVLFLLLIFLMVSSTFAEHPGIDLELPTASSAQPKKVEPFRLEIRESGELFFGGRRVELDDLRDELRAAIGRNPDLELVLQADRRVGYGRVIAAIDAARAAGVHRISAFTAPPEP